MARDEYFTADTPDDVTYVRIREDALFYTVDYYIEVAVKSKLGKWRLIFSSPPYAVRPNRTAVIEWLHRLIVEDHTRFEDRNIDFETLYACIGGDVLDLYQ